MKIIIIYVLSLLICTHAIAADIKPIQQKFGTIQTLVLHGTHEQMGRAYGQALRNELLQELSIIKHFYITQHGVSYEKLKAQAELFYLRFPKDYQIFIVGVAAGSHLSLDDAKILNAMETFGPLVKDQSGKCAFIYVPSQKTKSHSAIIGRNYDFPPPFDLLANNLTVTVLHEPDSVPTAFIAIAGEIYCPSCVNEKGLFMELNNGMPSGGDQVDQARQSLLINMLQIMQHSSHLSQMKNQLDAIQSDYSLIVNAADKNSLDSFEYSTTLGMKSSELTTLNPYVSTNFFLNSGWKNIAKPTDSSTWLGVSRRNHLLTLLSQHNAIDLDQFKSLMNKKYEDGGAVWNATIYQLIFDPNNLTLYIKINKQHDWNSIPLQPLFNEAKKGVA